MKGLNLSGFKKLKSDAKTTTLKHKDGHTITIKHDAIKPEHAKQLHALPFDEGGKVPDQSPPIDPSKVGGDVTTSGDPIVNAISSYFGSDSKAKGGKIQDPTQRNLLPGDKDPNKIEKQVVNKAKNYDEGGSVAEPNSEYAAEMQAGATGQPATPKARPQSNSSYALSSHTASPDNAKDAAYKKSVADFNSQMAEPKAEGGMIEHCPYCHANGGEVKGVHKDSSDPKGGTSDAGSMMATYNYTKHPKTSAEMFQGAKQEHKRVLGEMRSMPKPRLYAEGTDEVKDIDLDAGPTVEAIDPNSPEAQAPSQPQPMQAAPQQAPSQPQPTQETPPQQAPQTTDAEGNGIDPTLQPNGMPVQAAPPGIHQELDDEDKAWQNDLYNGHVQPERYKGLFGDKKSTLGKIGTAFGLLLGGVGAGITHTSNPVLDMMQKAIDNDIEAQKASKTNAQNFIKLNQAGQLIPGQINQLVQQGKLTSAQAKDMIADANIKAQALSRIQMNWAAFHDLTKQVESIPQGTPQRANADQQLAMLANQVGNENYNIKDRAAAASALSKAFNSTNDSGSDPEQAFQAQNRSLRLSGNDKFADDREAKHIPGVPGLASRPVPEGTKQEIQAMSVLDDKGKDVLSYVKQHSGSWNPKTRAVATEKIEEMKNFYNNSIKGGALTEGRLGWYDEQFAKNPTDILPQIMGSTAKLQEMVNSNAHRREMMLSGPGGFGFPSSGAASTQQQTTGMSKSGRPMIQRDGKWYYK